MANHEHSNPELSTPGKVDHTAKEIADIFSKAFTHYGLPIGYIRLRGAFMRRLVGNDKIVEILKDKSIRMKHPYCFTLVTLCDRNRLSLDYLPRGDFFVVSQRMPEAAAPDEPPMYMATIDLTNDEAVCLLGLVKEEKWKRGEVYDRD